MPEIGRPGQQVSILRGDDIDPATGRLLSVAELQDALAAAVRVRAARLAARSTPRQTLPAEPTVDSSRPGVGTGTDDAADSGTSPPDAIPIDTGRTDGGACPDREHPTVPDPEADRPDPTAPAAAAAAAVEAAGDDDAPGPPGERVREWGANPVPVSAGPGERPVMVQLPVQPSPSPGPGRYRFPVSDLLRCRPGDRDRRAARVLAGGWPGPRRVVVGSLTGGAGRSTTAAVMCAAAVDAGVPVLALDATGGDDAELAARIGSGAAAGRDWTRLTGRDAEVDFAALRRRAGADGNPVAVVAVGGDAGAPPPAEAVAAGAAAAATAWPLVLVDIGTGRRRPGRRCGRAGSICWCWCAGPTRPRSPTAASSSPPWPPPGRWTARNAPWSRSAPTGAAYRARRGARWPLSPPPRPARCQSRTSPGSRAAAPPRRARTPSPPVVCCWPWPPSPPPATAPVPFPPRHPPGAVNDQFVASVSAGRAG